MWPTTLCSPRVFMTFQSSQLLHDRGVGQRIGVLTVDTSPVYDSDLLKKNENWLPYRRKLVWLWGLAWRICAFVSRNHGRRLEPWWKDYPLLFVIAFSLFIPLSLLFAPYCSSIKNFELHSLVRIHVKQEWLPSLFHSFIITFLRLLAPCDGTRFGIWWILTVVEELD